jgi:hypothetical protein
MPKPASTTARGYGWQHQKIRQQWAPLVAAGQVNCARCGRPIPPGTAWDLGHDDHDRSRYTGPEHMTCNRTAGARKGARITNARRRFTPAVRIPEHLRWRPCVICGQVYRARTEEQRACSQPCGVEVRRRNRPPAKAKPQRRRPMCSECGQQFILPPGRGYARRLTCGTDCAAKRQARLTGAWASRTYTCERCGEQHEQKPGPGRPRTTCDPCRGITPPPTATRW